MNVIDQEINEPISVRIKKNTSTANKSYPSLVYPDGNEKVIGKKRALLDNTSEKIIHSTIRGTYLYERHRKVSRKSGGKRDKRNPED